jgi:hypothetical protein
MTMNAALILNPERLGMQNRTQLSLSLTNVPAGSTRSFTARRDYKVGDNRRRDQPAPRSRFRSER